MSVCMSVSSKGLIGCYCYSVSMCVYFAQYFSVQLFNKIRHMTYESRPAVPDRLNQKSRCCLSLINTCARSYFAHIYLVYQIRETQWQLKISFHLTFVSSSSSLVDNLMRSVVTDDATQTKFGAAKETKQIKLLSAFGKLGDLMNSDSLIHFGHLFKCLNYVK